MISKRNTKSKWGKSLSEKVGVTLIGFGLYLITEPLQIPLTKKIDCDLCHSQVSGSGNGYYGVFIPSGWFYTYGTLLCSECGLEELGKLLHWTQAENPDPIDYLKSRGVSTDTIYRLRVRSHGIQPITQK
jgi:hypothetical protein